MGSTDLTVFILHVLSIDPVYIKKSQNVALYSLETTGKDNNLLSDIMAMTPDDDKNTLNWELRMCLCVQYIAYLVLNVKKFSVFDIKRQQG